MQQQIVVRKTKIEHTVKIMLKNNKKTKLPKSKPKYLHINNYKRNVQNLDFFFELIDYTKSAYRNTMCSTSSRCSRTECMRTRGQAVPRFKYLSQRTHHFL